MADYSGRVIESQADYLTCSAHGEEASGRLEDYGQHLIGEEKAAGNDPRPWRTMGYSGLHCGQIDAGRRDSHSTILRVSGHPAQDVLSTALSLADHVTRLDVAVTWRAEPADPLIGANAYSMAEMFYQAHPNAGLPSRTQDAKGGHTTYIGDRRSPYYARVYNKEAERINRGDTDLAKHYARCWRYEVEAHDSRAMALADALESAEDSRGFVQQMLFEWFEKRGVSPAFPPSGAVALVEGFHRRTDDESRLRHLAKNVAPTVAKLRAHGHTQKVREALGFDHGEAFLRQLQRILESH